MPSSRYHLRSVTQSGGRSIARIFDSNRNEEISVYKRGRSFLRWDQRDRLVDDAALRRVAREALERVGVS